MRGKVKNRNMVQPDFTYNSRDLSKFMNYVMERGKKNTARGIVYGALTEVKEKLKVINPIEIFDLAIQNVGPIMEVRSRRIGGATYQVPRELNPNRRLALAMRWIVSAARSKKGSPMAQKLAAEIISASKNEGEAIKKRDNTHKMAEANRAFAHFAW